MIKMKHRILPLLLGLMLVAGCIISESSLTVHVLNADNSQAIQGAAVQLFRGSMLVQVRQTDEQGKALFTFSAEESGLYRLIVEKDGFKPGSESVLIRPNEAIERIILLQPEEEPPKEAKLTIGVFNVENNTPIQGAKVELTGGPAEQTKETDEKGEAIFILKPQETGRYTVTASMEGFQRKSTETEIEPGEHSYMSLALSKISPLCEAAGGTEMPEDYSNVLIDEKDFYTGKEFGIFLCSGEISKIGEQKCCINGNIKHVVVIIGGNSIIAINDLYAASFYIKNYGRPLIRAEPANDPAQEIDCSRQDSPLYDENECYFVIEQIFSSTGEKITKFMIKSGELADREFELTVNAIEPEEFVEKCKETEMQQASVILRGEQGSKSMNITTSGKLFAFSSGDKTFLADSEKAGQYAKYNPNATPEELHEITTNNSLIVEMKEEPALKYYTESFWKEAQRISGRFGIDSTQFRELKSRINKQIKARTEQLEREQSRLISSLGLSENTMQKFSLVFNGFSIAIPTEEYTAKKLSEIMGNPKVKRVYPNFRVQASLDQSVPMTNADKVWEQLGSRGKGVEIGIIDTGIDYTNADLGGCFGRGCIVKGGYDFVNDDPDPMDDAGHGTHVAGIAASRGKLKGVAPEAELYAVKVLDAEGAGSIESVIAGIEWSMDPNGDDDTSDHLDVINLSLGGWGNPDDPLSQAVDRASDAGIIVVVAAGNSGSSGGWYYYNSIGSPGTARNAITVGAAFDKSSMANFSSRGPVMWYPEDSASVEVILKPDISAPGVEICASRFDSVFDDSKCLDDEHISLSGTSMAAPHVAGIAALLREIHPQWTPQQIKSALITTAKEMIGRDNSTDAPDHFTQGSGFIDALEAAQPAVLTAPTVADIGNLSINNSKAVEITNVSESPWGILLPHEIELDVYKNRDVPKGEQLDTIRIQPEMLLSKNCLPPGESATLSVAINPKTVGYSIYAGNLKLGLSEGCTETTSRQINLPLSLMKAKRIRVNLRRNYGLGADKETSKITRVYLFTEDGNFITGKEYWREEAAELSFELIIPAEDEKVILLYMSAYELKNPEKYKLIYSTKELELSSEFTELTVDEAATEAVSGNIAQFFRDNNYQPVVVNIDFVPAQLPNISMSHSLSMQDACTYRMDYYQLFTLKEFDASTKFYLGAVSYPYGSNSFTTPLAYFHNDSADLSTEDKRLEFSDSDLAETTLVLNDSIEGINRISWGFSPYGEKARFIAIVWRRTRHSDKKIRYAENPEFGLALLSRFERKKDDPVELKGGVYYDTDFLFNGKNTEEFSWDWHDIPTGKMVNPIETMKTPVSFEDSLIIYNDYLQPKIITAYRKSRLFEWYLWLPEEVSLLRRGKTTVTTPSGHIIEGSGIYFLINCNSNSKWAWPKLYPCEEGEYKIKVETLDLFKDFKTEKEWTAGWNGSYWMLED